MSFVDLTLEVEIAVLRIIKSYKTPNVFIKTKKVKRANPALRDIYEAYIGRTLSKVLHGYEELGLIKIEGIKQNHSTKFYIKVLKPYYRYARALEKRYNNYNGGFGAIAQWMETF